MARAGFGVAKLGNEYKKIGKPGPGNNFLRVMPPMGNSMENPLGWYAYHATIWGFNGKNPTDPGKTIPRPIHSIEVSTKANGITVHDPLIDWINDHKNQTEAYVQAWMAKNNEADKKKAEATLRENDEEYKNRLDWERRFNVEKKVYILAMFKDNTFGAFKINFRDHLTGIKAKAKELEKDDMNAFDLDQGVWFNIRRDGNGVIPPDVVDIEMEDIEVDYQGKKMKVKNIIKAPLTEEQSNQALRGLPDLLTLGGDLLTVEQMVKLRDCSGDPDEVDEIFGGPVGGKKPQAGTTVVSVGQTGGITAGVVSVPADTINSRADIGTTEARPPEADPAIAARLEAIKAKKAKEAAAKKKAEEEAALAASLAQQSTPETEMSDEDFLAKFGAGA